MKGIAGEGQGNEQEWRQSARETRECQRNVWERVQSARGCWKMQGNARETYGCGCKLPGECRGTYGSGCSARGMQGSAGEFRGMPGKRMGVSVNCQGNAGNAGDAGECQE